jgi:hypothetical protein
MVTRRDLDSYDTDIMFQVTRSMLTEHSFRVHHDVFLFNSPYSVYGLGMSLLMAVPYELALHLGRDPVQWIMSVNAVLLAAIAGCLFLWASQTGASMRQALAVALATVFGTLLLPSAATGLSELGVGLGVAAALLAIEMVQRRVAWAALAGIAVGFAILMRADSAALVAPIVSLAVVLNSNRRWTAFVGFAYGLAPLLGLVFIYNLVRFHTPWQAAYQVWNHPFLAGLYGLLLSPSRGLFLYVPLALPALAGLMWAWRRAPMVTLTAAVLLAGRILLYAPWWSWDGGVTWGPRYLTPAMPVLAIGLLEVFRRWYSLAVPLRGAVVVLVAVSVSVQLIGATVRPSDLDLVKTASPPTGIAPDYHNLIQLAERPESERVVDSHLFDWRYFPIRNGAERLRDGRTLSPVYLGPPLHRRPLTVLAVLALFGFILAIVAGSIDRRVKGQTTSGMTSAQQLVN